MTTLELWREEFIAKDCYTDMTGRKHSGHVVHEQILVEDTGERFDVDDGYSKHKDLGKIYEATDGRRFGIYPETVSYSGGSHIRKLYELPPGYKELGYWTALRSKYGTLGRVYPDQTGPVTPLKPL